MPSRSWLWQPSRLEQRPAALYSGPWGQTRLEKKAIPGLALAPNDEQADVVESVARAPQKTTGYDWEQSYFNCQEWWEEQR